MQKENRELLLKTVGMVDGLFLMSSGTLQDALEIISNNLNSILDHESEGAE